jgi:hypothetical protein
MTTEKYINSKVDVYKPHSYAGKSHLVDASGRGSYNEIRSNVRPRREDYSKRFSCGCSPNTKTYSSEEEMKSSQNPSKTEMLIIEK